MFPGTPLLVVAGVRNADAAASAPVLTAESRWQLAHPTQQDRQRRISQSGQVEDCLAQGLRPLTQTGEGDLGLEAREGCVWQSAGAHATVTLV